ncbi:MAG: hypothetical protein IJJ47_08350 [Methanosphaera sp.]|nr:hypothetical protein [Methanosphaera sp.]
MDMIRNKNKTNAILFHEDIEVINKYMDNMADDLEQIELFDEEFYYFMDIRRMFNYISTDIKLYYENVAFIKEIFKSFKKLIFKKIEVESTGNMEINYAREHEEFIEFFYKQKENSILKYIKKHQNMMN